MKDNILSIFIDESGSLTPIGDELQDNLNLWDYYYMVTLVFHVQNDSISDSITQYTFLKEQFGFPHQIHFGPLIRRENDFFKSFSTDDARHIFFGVSRIIEKSNILWTSIAVDRRELKTIEDFYAVMSNCFDSIVSNNSNLFSTIKQAKVYYDNGQDCISLFIKKTIDRYFENVENKLDARPCDYILLEFADFICTVQLIDKKRKCKCASSSELAVFNDSKVYKKYMTDKINKKKLPG